MAEDVLLTERQTAVAGEISLDARSFCDGAMKCCNMRRRGKYSLHSSREGIGKPLHHLKQRKIGVAQGIANKMRASFRVSAKDVFEPAKVFGDPPLAKAFRTAQRLRLLVFVIEAAANGVMRVVNLAYEIVDGELNFMSPKPLSLISRRKAVLRAEIE